MNHTVRHKKYYRKKFDIIEIKFKKLIMSKKENKSETICLTKRQII